MADNFIKKPLKCYTVGFDSFSFLVLGMPSMENAGGAGAMFAGPQEMGGQMGGQIGGPMGGALQGALEGGMPGAAQKREKMGKVHKLSKASNRKGTKKHHIKH